ncbi:peptidase S1 [Thermobifida fusca]|nr:peptidase S1 [Thermobifida fusca]
MPAEEPQQRPRRNGMPLWAVLLLVMVVAAGSAGVGGMVGASLVAPEESPPPQSSGAPNNEVPSDVPSRAPDTIAGVAQRVSPSVVSIRSTSPQLSGNGSGFVIEGNYVVTNNHVVDAVRRGGIEVVYSDGHVSRAEVVGAAASSDLAVLKLADPLDVEPLEFGDSDEVAVGDTVIAIGAPLGLDGTVTSGIVSALNRPVTVGEDGQEAYLSAIQTDAAINPGNSGGPLVNEQGLVIGVNSAIATMSGSSGEQSGSIGLGFAIPSNQASRVVEQLIETGEAPHAVIGAILDLRYPEQGALIMEAGRGAETVMRGGPADQAGLRPGDVIVEFDGTTVRDATQLITLIHTKAPGDRVEVRYLRNGREHTTTLVLGSSND